MLFKKLGLLTRDAALGLFIALCFFGLIEFLVFSGLHIFLGKHRAEAFHVKQGRFEGPALNENLLNHQKGSQNSFGFLGPEFSIHKPKNTFRVLAIGGSAVSGEFTNALRLSLSENCPKKNCEVIDGGVPGSVSAHELNNLTRWLSFNPDLVVVYDGWNNVYFSHYATDFYLDETKSMDRRTKKWNRLDMWFIRHFYTVEFLRVLSRNAKKIFSVPAAHAAIEETIEIDWFGHKKSYRVDSEPVVADHFSDVYFDHLVRMAAVARQKKIPIIFFLQPSLIHGLDQKLSPRDEKVLSQFPEPTRKDWIKTASLLFPAAAQAQMRAQQEHKAPFFDLSGLGGKWDVDFFSDFVHLTPEGNQYAARTVIDYCRQTNLLKPHAGT